MAFYKYGLDFSTFRISPIRFSVECVFIEKWSGSSELWNQLDVLTECFKKSRILVRQGERLSVFVDRFYAPLRKRRRLTCPDDVLSNRYFVFSLPSGNPLRELPIQFASATTVVCCLCLALACASAHAASFTAPVYVGEYNSAQEAIDANPGRIIQLPPGEYYLEQPLTIESDGTELYGPAKIVQTNPKESMLKIENANGVRVGNLTLTRSEGRQQAEEAGVGIVNSHDVQLNQLWVRDNHSRASIRAQNSRDVIISGCTVTNYKGPVIDDRTSPRHLWGYAFNAIDGTGIQMVGVQNGIIRDNRIQEFRLPPNEETVARYKLGQLTIVPEERGQLMSEEIFRTHFTNNWHQGSGIHVSNPDRTSHILVTGNLVEHAGQGIDVHGDNVTLSHNIVREAIIGMKAMHGSKNVIIDSNQFSHVDLWGIMLMPGAASRDSANADETTGRKSVSENVDGGHIVSNNIISWFGFGENHWNWSGDTSKGAATLSAIAVRAGQLEENPPIRDVIITGNIVYDSGRDSVLVDGVWMQEPPRYRYALYIEQFKHPAPVNVHAYNNIFNPGTLGATNP